MGRKNTIYSSSYPYHITARSNNKEWFGLTSDICWSIFSDYLRFLNIGFGVKIHAFVLMKNHYHLLASFPDHNMAEAMTRFMTEVSRVMNFERGSINHSFGSRYKPSIIQNDFYFANAYKYVLNNPVRAGISEYAENYPYSSLNGQLGFSKLGFSINERFSDKIPKFENSESYLAWVNKNTTSALNLEISRSIRRTTFEFSGRQMERLGLSLTSL